MPLIINTKPRRHELLCLEGEAIAVASNIIEWAPIDKSIPVTVRRASMNEAGVLNPAEYHDGLDIFFIEWTESPNPSIEFSSDEQRKQTAPVEFSLNAALIYRYWQEAPSTPWTKVIDVGGRGDVVRREKRH